MKYLNKVFLFLFAISILLIPCLNAQQGQMDWKREIQSAPWAARYGHSSVIFNNRLWILGGIGMYSQLERDVWSTPDGVNWTCASLSAQWSARTGHSSVIFDNKIWVIGGDNNRDVWYSSDGINWNCATTTAWSWSKSGHSSVVYDSKIWVIGGNYLGNDVWYSNNGSQWYVATYNALWNERYEHTSVVFRDKVWVTGGISLDNFERFNDVWYAITASRLPEGIYTWWVTAFDRAGNSQRSNEIFTVQVDTTPPTSTAPISPINGIIITIASINFVWQRASDILSGIQYYKFQIAANPAMVNSNNISVLDTCIILNLPDTVYYWRLKAVDNVNNESEWSNIANFRVRAAGFIEEQSLHSVFNSKILIYPNPASSYLVIHFPLPVRNIKIFDITGKLVRSKELEVKNSQECRIDFYGIKNGVYFIKVDDGNSRVNRFTIIR